MTFCDAVEAAAALAGHCESRLQALKPEHQRLIHASTATGSVNIDEALRLAGMDQLHRYDYGVGLPPVGRSKRERAVWIEVHRATTKEVTTVLRKQQSLKDWLITNANDLLNMTEEYIWVPASKVDIPKQTRQYKQLANSGLRLCKQRPCTLA